ncbi:molybdopterin molybdotransferase MoeA [Sinimarinibacterium flocculans]|uniref:Molybdopterin molybdenumtransferase n=1 Tax=Sinimarinibacterium flocculans TaxID=985250 RepID=A0A318ED87_9GAMM|nr:molybdopterin molybdotransferase MoeA [Sinimarinibacterium flocculans]PXV65721.1 molybdopterin molybdochelatase [Sinimarinibacterium flocculans]
MSMLTIEDAWARLDAACAPLPAASLPLVSALGRVTAVPVHAACDLPPFDQSGVDGYALSVAGIRDWPARLPLGGTIAAGTLAAVPALDAGTAARIYTGGMIPQGADAVVAQEWVEREGESLVVARPVPVGQDIRRRGEELCAGTLMIGRGERLNAGRIAMLAAAGIDRVRVHAAPRVRVLVCGDEIVPAGRTLRLGEVYDANGPLIASWLRRNGYPDPEIEAVPDREAVVSEALRRAFDSADLVLSAGGVSVGDRDLIVPEAERLGAERLFWRVAQKPGKPVYAARHGRALLIGLPGNPGSVLVNLAVFVARVLGCLEAEADHAAALQVGFLLAAAAGDPQRDTWLRVRRRIGEDGSLGLEPLPRQNSHMISNLSVADALAWLPRSAEQFPVGTRVRCLSLRL